jgi:hypothetical protein
VTADYKTTLAKAILDPITLVRATFSGKAGKGEPPWRRVVVRPVLIKGEQHLQFSHFTATQDITKNYLGDQAAAKLRELLELPFASIHVETTTEDLTVQIARSGKATLRRATRTEERSAPNLAHDHHKNLPLPPDKPDPFLQRLGIMNADGKVAPSMHGKFTQINEFLKLLDHTGELDKLKKQPISILDCGSGSAYLSFAVYHYLNDLRGIPTTLTGVDIKGELIDKSNALAAGLDAPQVCFQRSAIIDYKPETPPDIVLALHACDTATDDAIAQGILNESRIIMCAPCCHHDLNEQLHAVTPFAPVMRHGILKERMADILTDSLRALVLRMSGYRTDVVEFVSSEHTHRNLMVRAVRQPMPGRNVAAHEFESLKTFWGVAPYLEKLLRERGAWPGV